MKPTTPPDEEARLAALRAYGVLDTPAEDGFDRITRIASAHFGVPIALVSLVDENRQWFKSCVGLDVRETGRDVSFCSHAILADEVLVIPDAAMDPRFADNPLVTGEPWVRFYAGAPIATPDGLNLGTVCIIDTAPRSGLDDREQALLADLAALVSDELELRHGIGRLLDVERSEREARAQLELALQAGHLGTWVWDLGGGKISASSTAETIGGLEQGGFGGTYEAMLDSVHPEDHALVKGAIETALASRGSLEVDLRVVTPAGEVRHHRILGSVTTDEVDNPIRLSGIVADLTEDKIREQALADALAEATWANNAKTELLSRASHDLRTPLNAILGFTQLIQLDPLNEEQESNVEEILRAGDRMLEMVNTVLDLAHAESGDLALDMSVSPARSILDTVTGSSNPQLIEQGIELKVELPPDSVMVLVDHSRLVAILNRLVEVAAARGSSGGVVSVGCREVGDVVSFEVRDDGPSLDEARLRELFEPFTSGLRVSLARERAVAEAMGARLHGSSQPDGGNTFVLAVPHRPESSQEVP